jgi:hypothetical protein
LTKSLALDLTLFDEALAVSGERTKKDTVTKHCASLLPVASKGNMPFYVGSIWGIEVPYKKHGTSIRISIGPLGWRSDGTGRT